MNAYTVTDNNNRVWKRVSKRTARKLWYGHNAYQVELVACPCKLHPFGMWNCGMHITADEMDAYDSDAAAYEYRYGSGFDMWEASAAGYNCDAECGYYLAWYIPA